MQTNAKAAAAAAKLTAAEQTRIINLVTAHGYTADKLQLLLAQFSHKELTDWVDNLNCHLQAYLDTVDEVKGTELTALAQLHRLARQLGHFTNQV